MDSLTDDPRWVAAVYAVIAIGVAAVGVWLGRKMLVVVVPVAALAFLVYAAIAIPSFLPARPSSLRNACVANLRCFWRGLGTEPSREYLAPFRESQ